MKQRGSLAKISISPCSAIQYIDFQGKWYIIKMSLGILKLNTNLHVKELFSVSIVLCYKKYRQERQERMYGETLTQVGMK